MNSVDAMAAPWAVTRADTKAVNLDARWAACWAARWADCSADNWVGVMVGYLAEQSANCSAAWSAEHWAATKADLSEQRKVAVWVLQ